MSQSKVEEGYAYNTNDNNNEKALYINPLPLLTTSPFETKPLIEEINGAVGKRGMVELTLPDATDRMETTSQYINSKALYEYDVVVCLDFATQYGEWPDGQLKNIKDNLNRFAVGRKIDPDNRLKGKDLYDAIYGLVASMPRHENWLFVVCNLDKCPDKGVFEKCVGLSEFVRVLCTSEQTNKSDKCYPINGENPAFKGLADSVGKSLKEQVEKKKNLGELQEVTDEDVANLVQCLRSSFSLGNRMCKQIEKGKVPAAFIKGKFAASGEGKDAIARMLVEIERLEVIEKYGKNGDEVLKFIVQLSPGNIPLDFIYSAISKICNGTLDDSKDMIKHMSDLGLIDVYRSGSNRGNPLSFVIMNENMTKFLANKSTDNNQAVTMPLDLLMDNRYVFASYDYHNRRVSYPEYIMYCEVVIGTIGAALGSTGKGVFDANLIRLSNSVAYGYEKNGRIAKAVEIYESILKVLPVNVDDKVFNVSEEDLGLCAEVFYNYSRIASKLYQADNTIDWKKGEQGGEQHRKILKYAETAIKILTSDINNKENGFKYDVRILYAILNFRRTLRAQYQRTEISESQAEDQFYDNMSTRILNRGDKKNYGFKAVYGEMVVDIAIGRAWEKYSDFDRYFETALQKLDEVRGDKYTANMRRSEGNMEMGDFKQAVFSALAAWKITAEKGEKDDTKFAKLLSIIAPSLDGLKLYYAAEHYAHQWYFFAGRAYGRDHRYSEKALKFLKAIEGKLKNSSVPNEAIVGSSFERYLCYSSPESGSLKKIEDFFNKPEKDGMALRKEALLLEKAQSPDADTMLQNVDLLNGVLAYECCVLHDRRGSNPQEVAADLSKEKWKQRREKVRNEGVNSSEGIFIQKVSSKLRSLLVEELKKHKTQDDRSFKSGIGAALICLLPSHIDASAAGRVGVDISTPMAAQHIKDVYDDKVNLERESESENLIANICTPGYMLEHINQMDTTLVGEALACAFQTKIRGFKKNQIDDISEDAVRSIVASMKHAIVVDEGMPLEDKALIWVSSLPERSLPKGERVKIQKAKDVFSGTVLQSDLDNQYYAITSTGEGVRRAEVEEAKYWRDKLGGGIEGAATEKLAREAAAKREKESKGKKEEKCILF